MRVFLKIKSVYNPIIYFYFKKIIPKIWTLLLGA